MTSRAIDALFSRGNALYQKGAYAELEALGQEWVTRFPKQSAKGWDVIAAARLHLGRLAEAEQASLRGLEVDPEHLDSWDRLGQIRNRLKRFADAHEAHMKALAIGPESPRLLQFAASNLLDLGRAADALVLIQRALLMDPDGRITLLLLAAACLDLGRVDESIAASEKLTALAPEWPDGWNSLGGAYSKRGRADEAVVAFQRALALNPEQAESWSNLGCIFRDRKQDQQALDCFNRAIDLKPEMVSAYINLGGLLHGTGHQIAAIEYFEHARQLSPTNPLIYVGLAGCFRDLSRFDEAVVAYCTALELKPDFDVAFNNLLFALNYHPTLPAEEIFKVYQQFEELNALVPRGVSHTHSNSRDPEKRLKIGYVSPDFLAHAVQNFLEPLLAHHDRHHHEIFAYADISAPDAVTERYRGYMDHWCVVNSFNDHELAGRIRADGIDILIDLAGHTANNRLKTFSLKPAPVQVTWLGYASTTGMSAIDYFLTSETLAPKGCEHLLAEKPWRLPSSCPAFVYRPSPGVPPTNPTPAVTNGYVTFGSLSRSIRLNDQMLETWGELLRRVPNSRLVINSRDFRELEMRNWICSRFNAVGIEDSRLSLGFDSPAWRPMCDMDIMLDCFPHNSATTLIEAVYFGLPVVSLAHRPTVGRVGASILSSIGQSQWIAADVEEYLQIATQLASDVGRLAEIRAGMREKVFRSSAMDEVAFCNSVEQAYRGMWAKYCAGSNA